jgi:hypothetical protein
MQPHLIIAPTERSPLIDFDHATGIFLIKGESYPEDAARFFGSILGSVREFFGEQRTRAITVEIELSYFNSSSAKALMNLFQALEAAAEAGAEVEINWHYLENDSAMREFGEDFAIDFKCCSFNLRADVQA